MLTQTTKKQIDFLLPVLLAAIVAFITFKKQKDIKFVVSAGIITLVLGYIITSQITKGLYLKGPAQLPTGPGAENYDPKALIDSIHQDIYCKFCIRNRDLYNQLIARTDAELIKCYNYWNAQYFADDKETLTGAIAGESGFFDSNFGEQQKAMALKFSRLNLQ